MNSRQNQLICKNLTLGYDGKIVARNINFSVNAVLEALMGASTSEIKDDYMKSFENYFNVKQGSEQYEHISINIIKMLESVNNNQPVTDKNIKAVAEKYLTETLGLSKAEVKKLKQQLK